MNIRPFRDNDWSSVREIYDLSKPDELRGIVEASDIPRLDADPEMLALFHGSEIFVAEDLSHIIGFGGNRGLTITWLFVHPERRRERVATALIRALLARMGGTATLNVATSNTAARHFYDRMGFTIEGEFVGKFKGHECGVTKLRHDGAG